MKNTLYAILTIIILVIAAIVMSNAIGSTISVASNSNPVSDAFTSLVSFNDCVGNSLNNGYDATTAFGMCQ